MLGQQPLLFLFYECCLGNGLLPLSLLLFLLQGPLLLVNCELVLPKPLNFTLMLQLSHPPSLGIHLLDLVVLGFPLLGGLVLLLGLAVLGLLGVTVRVAVLCLA